MLHYRRLFRVSNEISTFDKLVSLSEGLVYTFAAFGLGYVAAFIAVKAFHVRPGRRGTMINTFVNANTIS